MRASGSRSLTLLMKHVDSFCRFGFDNGIHGPRASRAKSQENVGRI